jgi:CheY-like chemotaxis protein
MSADLPAGTSAGVVAGAPGAGCMGARILIVDGDPPRLRRSAAALETSGYLIEQATGEAEAREFLRRSLPDLVLADFALTGIERLARGMKADRRLRQVAIVALTASAVNGESVSAYEAGFDGCLAKPVDTQRLPLQVAAFLVRGAGAPQPWRGSPARRPGRAGRDAAVEAPGA